MTAVAFDFSREWPFFPDDEKLRVFEPRANVAILIGRTTVEIGGVRKADPPLRTILVDLPSSTPLGSVAAIGTIATLRDGVERVVQNLITNPHITVLFLCGEDSPVFYPLEGLICLYRHGVDEGRHVLAVAGDERVAKVFARDALVTLSHADIACFRSRSLELVDCRSALGPAAFFADIAARLPAYVRPVTNPSWAFLEAIDIYRWRPRVLQVPAGVLETDPGLGVARAGDALVLWPVNGGERDAAPAVVATGKSDGRAQRALHTALRRGMLAHTPGWESRLAAVSLAAERAVLASEFPDDAARLGLEVPEAALPATWEPARTSALSLDPTGFFKLRVLYERDLLAADYHAANGRHVETLHARTAEDMLVAIVAGAYVGDYAERDQHLVYLGVQIGRAEFALRTGLRFEEGQPLASEARVNVDHHLSAATVVTGTSLEEIWLRGLASLRENGLLTTTQKGRVAEGWCTFFLVPAMERMAIPAAYPATEEHVDHYARELLAPAPEVRAHGDYTYGDRTCHYYFDQIAWNGRRLAAEPDCLCINQRWVPEIDLPATAHHRPCLVFDLWFRHGERLHTLQIARSHDVYGGLPQNALGVARSWGRVLAAASGTPLGDLCFLSVSNNYRVGDDAENVRRAIQGGIHSEALAAVLPVPTVESVAEKVAGERLVAAECPIAAVFVPQVAARAVPAPAVVLATEPVLAARLLRYRGTLDQVQVIIERLRVEMTENGRERSNSLLLSPRDPLADREREATPLVCLQLRRQVGRLHAAAVVVGASGAALTPLLIDLQRTIATSAGIPAGSALIACVAAQRHV
jgi:hypothetical protein